MIIQCISCGFSKFLNYRYKTAEELEAEVNNAIVEGWRYSSNYQGFICPKCCKSGGDPLLTEFQGKIRKANKENSYLRLLYNFTDWIRVYRELGEAVDERFR